MSSNPDIYLLYEYMEKVPFTVRIKVQLDTRIDVEKLTSAAREAIGRYPYFSVQVDLDEGQNYILKHNEKPIAVLPEKNERLVLGSDEVNDHLKLVGSPVSDGELAFPDADKLPADEPLIRYTGGDSNLVLGRFLKYLLNPFAKDNYYYQIEIPTKDFMDYAVRIDGTPNTILAAIMAKVVSRMVKEKKNTHISVRIAADYRSDIGADLSYRDFVRFIHIKYDWSMKNESIEKLNMRARGAIISQNQPELSCERFVKLEKVHNGIDSQPDLKSKKKFASKNSTFRSDPRVHMRILWKPSAYPSPAKVLSHRTLYRQGNFHLPALSPPSESGDFLRHLTCLLPDNPPVFPWSPCGGRYRTVCRQTS